MNREKTIAALKKGGDIAIGATALTVGIIACGTYQMGKDIWAGLKSVKEAQREAVGQEAPQV